MADYRIDDLARASGVTTRNIRAYQERGLLPRPSRRDGRALIYDESHLERLRIIDSLLERGFTIAHIADFITSWETGKDLTEVLGLQHAITATFAGSSTEPRGLQLPRDMVVRFLDKEGTGANVLDRLASFGLLRVRDDMVEFADPKILEIFGELQTYGFSVGGLTDLFGDMMKRLTEIAELLVVYTKDHIVAEHGPGWLPEADEVAETAQMIDHLRVLGVTAVRHSLARALERVVNDKLADYLAEAVTKRAKP